ncbi:Protein scd2/ral3 [Yarrowia sp. C11]|nr:Protein scd2/ral3 [Yarrowia sp. E02]KAG5371436.1 Protein scd2/ral3 [Yarrowia sp. C11]
MVIRALYDYEPQGPGELPFSKGDFFHVISNEQDSEWFEAFNPLGNVRGMVPVPYFEILGKKEGLTSPDSHESLLPEERKALHRSSQSKHAQHSPQQVLANGLDVTQSMQNLSLGGAGGGHTREPSMAGASDRSSQGKNMPSLYGVVLYDFQAERPDELQASKGDAIIVIAQSNHEWFVAKPIGRLGGPGLIPVSFIEIRNMASGEAVVDVEAAVRAAGVPKVEEWKKMAADYKASSIPLGKFDDPQQHSQHPSYQQLNQSAQQPQQQAQMQQQQAGQDHYADLARGPLVIAASVESFAFDSGRYWYLVNAELEDGSVRRLCRYYQDFYVFQIHLLGAFQEAAGRTDQRRLLPYMPGPLTYVNDSISKKRRANLDEYVRNLMALPTYISHSVIVQELFAIRPGDVEASGPTEDLPRPLTPEDGTFDDAAQAEAEAKGIEAVPMQASLSTSSVNYSEATEGSRPVSSTSGLMGPPASTGPSGGGHQRMTSVSTVGPTPDNPAVNTPQSSSNSVKVKVFYQDDLIAIRVPSDIDYATLHDRLCERLRVEALSLLYKADDGNRVVISNDEDLGGAVYGKNKLVLYAN